MLVIEDLFGYLGAGKEVDGFAAPYVVFWPRDWERERMPF